MYVIRLKSSELYLSEDDSHTPNPLDATHYDDFADAKEYSSQDEEVVEIDENGNVKWVE